MAVGVFPALKLGVLFMKQISKPLAKVIVTHAKNHPVFRTYFIIPPAQYINTYIHTFDGSQRKGRSDIVKNAK